MDKNVKIYPLFGQPSQHIHFIKLNRYKKFICGVRYSELGGYY